MKNCWNEFLFQTSDLLQVLSDVLYECVTMEKPEVIASHIDLDQVSMIYLCGGRRLTESSLCFHCKGH